MQTITTGNRQCFLDLAMQYAGAVESSFEIAYQANRSFTDEPAAGTIFPAPVVVNANIVAQYVASKVKPASIDIVTGETAGEGIGYWIVDNDFKVS